MKIFLYFLRKINSENLMIQFKLQVFHACVENMSFTKASEKLFITQPAVTKNIKELETQMGIKLFERSKSGISLTQAGVVLRKHSVKYTSLVGIHPFLREQEVEIIHLAIGYPVENISEPLAGNGNLHHNESRVSFLLENG